MSFCDYTTGCTNANACNYDETKQLNDGSCEYMNWCGECVAVGAEPEVPCLYDCLGVYNGTAVFNECGDCVHPDDNPCVQGCDGVWANIGAEAVVDGCGNCSPGASPAFCDPSLSWASNEGCDFCCDGTPVCPGTMPGSCGSEVIDECGVCGGLGETCDASLLIDNWVITGNTYVGNWNHPFEGSVPNSLVANLNCDEGGCKNARIDVIPDMKIQFGIKPYGAGFDVAGTGDLMTTLSDLTINMKFAVHVNRVVSVTDRFTGEVYISDCHDIFGTASNPRISDTVTYDPATYETNIEAMNFDLIFDIIDYDAENHLGCEHDCGELRTGLHFFNHVPVLDSVIPSYYIDSSTQLDAVYQVKMYISEFEILGYNPDFVANNITVNDINNPITTELTVHHNPVDWTVCDGLVGDTNNSGTVNCEDWQRSQLLVDIGICEGWYTGTTNAPPDCCNVAAADGNQYETTQEDVNAILEMIVQSGNNC